MKTWIGSALILAMVVTTASLRGQSRSQPAPPKPAADVALPPKLADYKKEVVAEIDSMDVFTQQMVDQVFSFGELGFQEFETSKYLTGILEEERLHDSGESRRHSDRVDGELGIGQAGDRARVRHRLHPAGVAEAGRRVSRSDDRGRARARRGAQLGRAAQHHRGAGGEEDHGARASVRARSSSGPASPRSCWRAKAYFVRAGVFKDVDVALFAHVGATSRRQLGRQHEQRPDLGRVHVQGRERARGRRAVARPLGARRRGADGHRLELPPRAPAARSSARTTSSPTAAISRTSCRRRRPSGTTSARPTTRTSRSSGRSATRWRRAPR